MGFPINSSQSGEISYQISYDKFRPVIAEERLKKKKMTSLEMIF